MANRPKPTRLKVLTGNPGKRPLPKNEPQPSSDLPDPPEHLDEYAREEWNRLASGLFNMGLLFDVDRAVFAAYCAAYSTWRKAQEILNDLAKKDRRAALVQQTTNGNIIQHTLVGTANKAMGDMLRYASEFGLTPRARAMLAVEPGSKGKGKFEGLINYGRQ